MKPRYAHYLKITTSLWNAYAKDVCFVAIFAWGCIGWWIALCEYVAK